VRCTLASCVTDKKKKEKKKYWGGAISFGLSLRVHWALQAQAAHHNPFGLYSMTSSIIPGMIALYVAQLSYINS